MARMSRRRFAACALALLGLSLPGFVAAQQPAHVHGLVKLGIAVDAAGVTVTMHAPLDSLLGFERPPRNAAEREAAQAMLARLEAAQTLFVFEPAAQCSLRSSKAESDALRAGAKADDHADLEGTFAFACANAAAVRSVDLGGLLDAFKRIARIDAQIVTGSGQSKRSLKRPERTLRLGA